MNSRYRTILSAVICFVAVWVIAWGGYTLARNSKMTADKVRDYMAEVDLRELSGEQRAKALRDLAAKITSLSPEERRKFRSGRLMKEWFDAMTEEEKGDFMEATMPSGFKQMITAFEKMPEEKRRKAVDDAMKRMKDGRESDAPKSSGDTNNSPELSKELQEKVATIGLKSFYSQSSAQTKAELAPLMEEIQKNMESGRAFRGR